MGCLKTRHIGEKESQQSKVQHSNPNLSCNTMKETDHHTFTTKLTTLVNKAASLGHTMEDETLVRKLLNAIPDRYLQIVASIEQYSDLDEMSLEEAIGRLKTYKERRRGRRRHKFSQERNHENFKEERKDGETSHRSYATLTDPDHSSLTRTKKRTHIDLKISGEAHNSTRHRSISVNCKMTRLDHCTMLPEGRVAVDHSPSL
ncbi:hypothetical protein Tco_1548442 [Tanacetum coccineum]